MHVTKKLFVRTSRRAAIVPNYGHMLQLEFVSGYEASGWQGLGAPKNTGAKGRELLLELATFSPATDPGDVQSFACEVCSASCVSAMLRSTHAGVGPFGLFARK